jgi:hypothetical protein
MAQNNNVFSGFIKEMGGQLKNPGERELEQAKAIVEEQKARDEAAQTKRIIEVGEDLAKISHAKPMPKSVFIQIFWPMFSGKLNEEEQAKRMAAWVVNAGSQYAEVPIVDDITGKVLLMVPPMMTTDNFTDKLIQLQEEGKPALSIVSSHAEAMRLSGRINEANQLEEKHLYDRLPDSAAVRAKSIINAFRWNDIAEAFGLEYPYPKLAKRIKDIEAEKRGDNKDVSTPVPTPVVEKNEERSYLDDIF